MIDPQMQANIWVHEMVGKKEIRVLRPNMLPTEILFQLENAISFGNSVLLENLGEEIDSIFDGILQNKKIKQGGVWKLKMGEKIIDYAPAFKLYMTTKLSNPHYPPEICVKVTLTFKSGDAAELHGDAGGLGGPDAEHRGEDRGAQEGSGLRQEESRQLNIKEFFENKSKQKHTEDKILRMMSEAQGNILDNEELINTLQQSKVESNEIEEKLKLQEVNREQFKTLQNFYKDCAKRSANLYFAVADLAMIEPVYQFSLDFYINIFERAVERAPFGGKNERVKNINATFTQQLFQNIIRSLLEKDKLTFSLLLCTRIL